MLNATLSMDPATQAELLALSAELTTRREVTVVARTGLATVPPPSARRPGR